MRVGNVFRIVGGMALVSAVLGCQAETTGGDEDLASSEAQLASCAAPALGTGSVCRLPGGQLQFQVTLPAGQQYVELFVRQNGVQNVASAIQASGVESADGSTTYALVRSGYAAADQVEYRFYSYRPASPGVFTPGPAEAVWYGFARLPVVKDAAAIYSSYGTGPSADRNFGGAASVDIGEYHLTSEGLFGYALAGIPAGAAITGAELVIPAAYAPGGFVVHLRLHQVTAPWSESTVTWNNKPARAFVRDVVVDTTGESRLDVTAQVAAALAAGEVSFVLQPSSLEPSVDNVFIDAKEKPGGAPTWLDISWTT